MDLLSDLHIGCRIKFKYQNAHNSKHQITLDLKFSINAGKFKSNTTNGIIRDAMSWVQERRIYIGFVKTSSYPISPLYNML